MLLVFCVSSYSSLAASTISGLVIPSSSCPQRQKVRPLSASFRCMVTTLLPKRLAKQVLCPLPTGQIGNSHSLDAHCQNGLAAHGHCSPGALNEIISQLGPDIDFATYACLLRRCTIGKNPHDVECVHNLMIRRGYVDNLYLNNLLVQTYGKCGSLQHACAVFDNMVYRSLYSWTIMLAACAQNRHAKGALQLYGKMQAEGLEIDMIVSICILQACASVAALEEGREIHANVVDNGWESDVVVGTALVNVYGKCGCIDDARAVFVEMPSQDIVSWNAMISACAQNGYGQEAIQLCGQMQANGVEPNRITSICILDACASLAALDEGREIHACIVGKGGESDVVVGNALVDMYGKCQSLDDASAVFAEMTWQNAVSWNSMIAASVQNGHSKEALQLFVQMQAEGFEPNRITCVCVLDACANVSALEKGQAIHALVVGNRWQSDVLVGTALVNMYSNCGNLDDAKAVFAEIAWQDVVSWSAMIAACAQNGHGKEALKLFGQMQAEGFEPNRITLMWALNACASVAALEEGRDIHAIVVGNGWNSHVAVGTALVNMYGNCGSVDDARAVFAEITWRDVVLWSSMITVCAQNGHCKEALDLFDQMQDEGFEPDKITFTGVLTACSHMGLVADGKRYFASMSQDYGISPSIEHYVCIIDLLGRAGQLDKAEQLINDIPFKPIASAWLSLLSSCRIHGDVKRGIRVANSVFALDKKNALPYILLADIHAGADKLEYVQN